MDNSREWISVWFDRVGHGDNPGWIVSLDTSNTLHVYATRQEAIDAAWSESIVRHLDVSVAQDESAVTTCKWTSADKIAEEKQV